MGRRVSDKQHQENLRQIEKTIKSIKELVGETCLLSESSKVAHKIPQTAKSAQQFPPSPKHGRQSPPPFYFIISPPGLKSVAAHVRTL